MERLPQGNRSRDRSNSRGLKPSDCLDLDTARSFREDDAANDERMSQLARAIEHEIIPRLMLAHRTTPDRAFELPLDDAVTPADVLAFAQLVLSHNEDVAFESVEVFRRRGVTIDKIYLDLLAPTARHLGKLWDDDLCSFTDVTVGLGRLQRVLRELSSSFGQSVDHPSGGRRILLLPSPGEQHTFGLVMVAEFFNHAGWDVTGGAWASGADGPTMVADEWFDVVGFSLGSVVQMGALRECIAAVRQATCNQELAVLVGGPLFGEHPEYAADVGADGMTVDGREAPVLAERLIVRLAKR